MEYLLNPNVAYILLSIGMFFSILALLSPGTGVLEIFGIVTLIVAGYAIYFLPINYWALLILLVGAVLFFFAIRKPNQIAYLIASIVAMILGSAFLFSSGDWWVPAVNPLLALVISLLMGTFFWIVGRKFMEMREVLPTHDLAALIGEEGVAKTEIHEEGSVQVSGELWTATSTAPIPEGAHIRVIGRDGFILTVEAIEQN